MMQRCERCGAQNRPQAKFCSKCGALVAKQDEWRGEAALGAYKMAEKRAWLNITFVGGAAILVGIIMLILNYAFGSNPIASILIKVGVVFNLLLLLRIWLWLLMRILDALRGAEGEERIAKLLDSLPRNIWNVAHDLPFHRFNVDHLVFGRGGIFLVETKNWTGRIEVLGDRLLRNGRRPFKNPVRQASRTAIEVAEELEKVLNRRPFVNAVLCFTKADIAGVKTIGNVKVMQSSELLSFFRGNFREVLSNSDVERIKAWILTKRARARK